MPKAVEGNGLTDKNITFTDEAIQTVINRYTREAGVRNLEREINSICRKVARKVVVEGTETSEEITPTRSRSISACRGIVRREAEEQNEVGVATGLAWTEVGGEILVTEATLMPGRGRLTLTGKLGDVMQESAQAAMSYVRSRAEEFGIAKDFNRRLDVHMHIPEGAIPKDGPSAGITLATALISALARVPARRDVAMTGEITLRGKVLPIGGVKEKVLAAHRAGIKNIILPKDNEKDLADIPKNVLDAMNLYLVTTMDEVLKHALAGPLTPIPPTPDAPVTSSRRRAGRDDALMRQVGWSGWTAQSRSADVRPGDAFLNLHRSQLVNAARIRHQRRRRGGLPEERLARSWRWPAGRTSANQV